MCVWLYGFALRPNQTHQQLKQEASRLKQQLVHAKAYTLHKSLAQTIRDSREQTDRLRKIIEHVKVRHAALSRWASPWSSHSLRAR